MSGVKVCVIGLWHLGSVTAACLADLGYRVAGLDADAARVERLDRGAAPLFEPGLDEIIAANLAAGRLTFTTDAAQALAGATYAIIAHDTPVDEQDEVDLAPLFASAAALALHLQSGATVIVSSQVPVGTCEQLAARIHELNPSLGFGIAYLPENLRLGQAIERFRRPDMLVIGADDGVTCEAVDGLLSAIEAPRVKVGLRTAEMIKHAINCYLATSISFIGEIAAICDEVGADALAVARALRLDSRIGPGAPLQPGLGFAGGTLARDLKALLRTAGRHGLAAPLTRAVLAVNEAQGENVLRKLHGVYASLQGRQVGVLGLTYKPGTSTLRRSAALEFIRAMAADGASIRAYDPKADPDEVRPHSELTLCDDPYAVAQEGDALLLATPWPEFGELDFGRIRRSMHSPVLLDPHNMLDADAMAGLGFLYLGTGRGCQARLSVAPEGTAR
ncbi:MAG: nucleotide sugar dehydrogenase [Dehalococcoidia bacterium]|nr:nucleotide sugar dehydrogenase [Dehalococcoidia bacterium]